MEWPTLPYRWVERFYNGHFIKLNLAVKVIQFVRDCAK
jgi:hypothetical protein